MRRFRLAAWVRAPGAGLLVVGVALFALANRFGGWWGFTDDQIELAGVLIASVGALAYVAARRATLRQLHLDESELHLLASQMPADVWTTDTELRFTSVSGALLARLDSPEMRVPGRTVYEVFGTRDVGHQVIAAHLKALRGESASYERVVGELVVEGRVEPLRDQKGRIIGCVGTAMDVSTWRWAESQVRRFAALVQSSEDAILSTDLGGKIESWNQAAERLYGYSAEEMLGRSISVLEPPDRAGEAAALRERLGRGERVPPYETVRRRRDGTAIEISTHLSPMRDELGKLVGVSAVIRDITDRKRAEAKLARLASFLEMSPLATVEVDVAGRISFMNPAAERRFPDLRDAPSLHPFVAGAWALVGDSQGAGTALHTREVRVRDNWYFQNIYALPDGSHLRIYASDITERRKAEEAVRESERRFRTVLDRMRLMGLGTDPSGAITYCNDYFAEVTGWTREALIGSDYVARFIPPGHPVIDIFKRALATGEMPVHYQNEILTRTGARRLVEWDNTLLRDEAGRVASMVSIGVDVTERAKAEHELRQSEERLRALAQHLESAREEEQARIAREIHDELAQSLTALRLDLSWLAKRVPGADQAVRAKMTEMTALAGATIEAGRRIAAELRPPILDDLGLIAALEWYVQDFARRTALQATLHVGPQELALDGRLAVTGYRIVQEALTNVARHAEAKRVTVRLGERDGALVLEITDDGRGIRADAAASGRSFGIVGMRERAAAHGGALEVASAPGGGTVVRATIPLERRQAPRGPA